MSRQRSSIVPLASQRVTPSHLAEEHGNRHMYPFRIELAPNDDADAYRIRMSDRSGRSFELSKPAPVFDLAEVWEELSPGYVRLNALAVRRDESVLNYGYSHSFFKATPYQHDALPDGSILAKRIDSALDTTFDFLVQTQVPGSFDPDLPPIVWHCVLRAESRELYPEAYPGLHYGNYIDFLHSYAAVRPQQAEDALSLVHTLVRKVQEFVTPSTYAWPGYPYSTISRGQLGGDQELDDTIQPVKAAMVGCAIHDHGVAVGDEQALAFARHIGQVLADKQASDGSLPFRVDARTGRETPGAGRTTSLIFAANLWERLDAAGRERFVEHRRAAVSWMLQGPARNHQWIADFEDVPTSESGEGSNNYNNLDAMAMAHYLLRHRHEDSEYVDRAAAISRWIEEGFVFYASEYPVDFLRFSCPAVMEQSWHYYPINGHLAGFAKLQLILFEATGAVEYKHKALACAGALLDYIKDDGEMLTYAPDPGVGYGYDDSIWFGCVARVARALLKVRAVLDE